VIRQIPNTRNDDQKNKTMKTLTYFILLALLTPVALSAQFDEPCLPEGITFSSQAQIDSFQSDYPNCTEIEGDVEINGNDIINLNGLNVITSIGGNLQIQGNIALISLTGLDNVNSIGDYLSIYNNDALISLTGLDNVNSIGGELYVYNNDALISLTGLGNVASIGGNLIFFWNLALTSLTGLDNLTSISGDLSICNNDALTSLTGLDNLDAGSISNLTITGNSSLTTCDVESLCNYLANPSGTVNIYSNATGCNNPPEVANACGFTIPCLPYGNYYFLTQAEIDSFQTDYPNCTEIQGAVTISGVDITNLEGLNVLTVLWGRLSINGNAALINLLGLDNVTSIGGNLSINGNAALINLLGLDNVTSIGGGLGIVWNDALTNLSGLDNVTAIGGNLIIGQGWFKGGNPSLTSLTGLDNVTAIGGNFYIGEGCFEGGGNPSLTSLTGLDNVTSIGGSLLVYGNNSLTSLSGLYNVTSIGGYFTIDENDSLTSLSGLDNIDENSMENLRIYNNISLSTCEVQSVCDFLAAPNGTISIYDNATGCNSPEEVEEACETVNVDETRLSDQLSIYPNPFSTSTTIEYVLTQPEKVELKIYNQLGKMIEVIQKNTQPGKQTLTWDANGLPSGIYFLKVQFGNELISRKMLKLK